MEQERDQEMSPPIACTLTAAEVAAMREGLLPGLVSRAAAREPIAGGFRFQFVSEPDLVKQAAAVIDAEHRCCRFLRFVLLVEPGDGAVSLEVTGPAGAEEFLAGLLDAASKVSDRG